MQFSNAPLCHNQSMKKTVLLVLACLACFGYVQTSKTSSQSEVYYEIFVRSFQDSDGDGVGDLVGATERLEYLEDLGIGGVWLMPIHPSPSYHGYDVTDYYAINPDYGTLADFKTFITEAHARGIKVVIDLVVNHTSSRHPWFLRAETGDESYRDYYSWSDTDLGWRGTSGAPAWHASDSDYYLGLFWSGMPDLNFRNPEVVREIQAVARFWLELGVDGFRIDAIQHVIESRDGVIRNTPENIAWVKDFEAFIKIVNEDAFLVGETWTDTETIARYFEKGNLDVAFNYPLWDAVLSSIQARNAIDLAFALEQDARLYPAGFSLATFISNHDQVRPATSLSLLSRDVLRLKLAAGLLLTLPGTPYIYYGEEIGLPNGPGDKDEEKRTPMRWHPEQPFAGFSLVEPWYPFSTDDPDITVAAQQADPESLLNWYKQLIAVRVQFSGGPGALTISETSERALLAFKRGKLLVLANFGNNELAFDLAQAEAGEMRDLLTDEVFAGSVALPKLGFRVLEQTE